MDVRTTIDLGQAEILVAGQRMTGTASVSLPVDAQALAAIIAGGPLSTTPAPLPPVYEQEPDEAAPVVIDVPVLDDFASAQADAFVAAILGLPLSPAPAVMAEIEGGSRG